jgi:hypothetical protein
MTGTLDIVVLYGILQDFYANVRTSSGDYYFKSSLVAIHQGIRRYLQKLPYNRDIDIVTDMKLKKANDALSKIYAKEMSARGKRCSTQDINPIRYVSIYNVLKLVEK